MEVSSDLLSTSSVMPSINQTIYDKQFAQGAHRRKPWTPQFAQLLLTVFQLESIVDFGCGSGDLLSAFPLDRVEALGIDGSKACARANLLPSVNFKLFDLHTYCALPRKYDVCVCLEVAEHLPSTAGGPLLDSLVAASDVIVFSAAPRGQGGVGHVHCQPYYWWVDKFRDRGFCLDVDATSLLQTQMDEMDGMKWWYTNNLMVVRKKAPPPLSHRKHLPGYLAYLKCHKGVEIGVHKGAFSAFILKNWDGFLWSIDPWVEQQGYTVRCGGSQEALDQFYATAVEALQPFSDRCHIVREFSKKASEDFSDGSIDFVYIDGRHTYDAVSDDLNSWYPKVRLGGVVSGHDYVITTDKHRGQVRRAVLEFFANKKEEVRVTAEGTSWWVIKGSAAQIKRRHYTPPKERHSPGLSRIELSLTHRCNLTCSNCHACCSLAPDSTDMPVSVVNKFVQESLQLNWKWDLIKLYGGEPCLHPELLSIIDVLSTYIQKNPKTKVRLLSNGIGEVVQQVIKTLPPWIQVRQSSEEGRKVAFHESFFEAPVDLPNFRHADFSKGCFRPKTCGCSLDPTGKYFVCAPAVHIDRVFNRGIGLTTLGDVSMTSLARQMTAMCKLCGLYKSPRHFVRQEVVSSTWRQALRCWKERRG